MKSLQKSQQRFLLVIPAIVLPFVCMVFYVLGGGKGVKQDVHPNFGLNSELPKPSFDPKQTVLDKLKTYENADRDSLARKQNEQRDSFTTAPRLASVKEPSIPKDDKAGELVERLNRLQKAIDQPAPVSRSSLPSQRTNPGETDPQLDRLNGMLDKVIRIQHPTETSNNTSSTVTSIADEVLPADSTSNTIAVTVPEKQVLVTGATIALRLEDDVRVNKVLIPRGQLVYGVVSLSNDRMLVHINAIRSDRNIYPTDLQVFDLDGLAGIHIPGQISRDVAKESADQGLSGLNLMTYDPSLRAQAANAGIQTAKSLFGRKVRQVRVTVRAGYRLLLRNTRINPPSHTNEISGEKPGFSSRPPGFVPGGTILKTCTVEGMELALSGIFLQDEVLWFALTTHNSSPITYIPEYTRWFIRDRRAFRRTAMQEIPLTPISSPEQSSIAGDSTQPTWIGFHPFALTKEKEMVIQIGEKNGGRVLTLAIDHKQILKAQKIHKDEED